MEVYLKECLFCREKESVLVLVNFINSQRKSIFKQEYISDAEFDEHLYTVTLGRSIKFRELQEIFKLNFIYMDFRDKLKLSYLRKKILCGHNSDSLIIHAL